VEGKGRKGEGREGRGRERKGRGGEGKEGIPRPLTAIPGSAPVFT